MQSDQIWNDFLTLPVEVQRQAADFIAFLLQRSQKTGRKKVSRKIELSQEPFVGMWRDRAEMQDSTEWVRDLRQKEWTR